MVMSTLCVVAVAVVVGGFNHRFKGEGLPPIDGQTPWERKHGILPKGSGFVYDHPGITNEQALQLVAESEDFRAHQRDRRQLQSCHRLEGLFVRPCGMLGTYGNLNVTQRDTRFYGVGSATSNASYTLDRTYYIGEGDHCYPATMNTFFQLVLHGEFVPHGPNTQIESAQPTPGTGEAWLPHACKADMRWGNSEITLGDNPQGYALARTFTQFCPCNITWTVGVQHNVSVKNCGALPSNESVGYYWCHIIAGGEDSFNYQWSVKGDAYITSPDNFTPHDYSEPLDNTYVRHLIPSTGNNQYQDCTVESPMGADSGLKLHRRCNPPICTAGFVFNERTGVCASSAGDTMPPAPGIPLAEVVCNTCTGFECDGCLFDSVTTNWVASQSNNTWQDCCPCFFEAGREIDHSWEQVQC